MKYEDFKTFLWNGKFRDSESSAKVVVCWLTPRENCGNTREKCQLTCLLPDVCTLTSRRIAMILFWRARRPKVETRTILFNIASLRHIILFINGCFHGNWVWIAKLKGACLYSNSSRCDSLSYLSWFHSQDPPTLHRRKISTWLDSTVQCYPCFDSTLSQSQWHKNLRHWRAVKMAPDSGFHKYWRNTSYKIWRK